MTKTIIRSSNIKTVYRCPECKEETEKGKAIKEYGYMMKKSDVIRCPICRYTGEFEHIEIETITRERPVKAEEDKQFERINCMFDNNPADAEVYICYDCWDVIEEFRNSERRHLKNSCKGVNKDGDSCQNTKINPQGYCHWHKDQAPASEVVA